MTPCIVRRPWGWNEYEGEEGVGWIKARMSLAVGAYIQYHSSVSARLPSRSLIWSMIGLLDIQELTFIDCTLNTNLMTDLG
jgi:hypothetical protein